MNNHLRILIVIITSISFLNAVFSQNDNLTNRQLLIKIQRPGTSEMEERKLIGDEAIHFDVARFLAKNQNATIEIGGSQIKDREVVKYTFNSRELSSSNYFPNRCKSFCSKEISSQHIALLGVATKSSDDSEGIRITRIIDGSAADHAGLQVGDVIMYINEMDILSGCDLKAAINLLPVGAIVEIHFIRNNVYTSLFTTLGYKMQRIMSWEPCCDKQTTLEEKDKNRKITLAPKLNVYPNPSSGIFRLQFQSTINQAVSYFVTNATGKEIYSNRIVQFKSHSIQDLNLTGVPEGIYFLHLYQEDWKVVEKLVIQKP